MKKLTFLMMAVTTSLVATAQLNNYYNRMNHVFGAIDKSKVTTGLLKEFGVRLNHVENYAGSMNTTNFVDVTQWQSLYHSLYTMRVGTATSMTAPASVYAHLESQQAANPNTILLAAMYYTYQQYKSAAYSNGDVTVSNDRIYDVAGRNPYDTKTAFAAAPMEYHLEGNTFAFKLQSNMLYTNTTKTLSSVQVDFGNGQGYQALSLNTVKNVTYSSGGEKELKVKLVYSGGPTLYSHSRLWVDYVAPATQLRYDGNGLLHDAHPITGEAWSGAAATGEVTVELAPGHTELTRPLIVIEGFDPENEFDYFRLINTNFAGGLNRVINTSTGLTLNQAIEAEGYDLVFVNFRNSTDYLQRNAYMVEAVIEWVNGEKAGNAENVVLGMSMGGLVARYALRHMETTGRTHETGLYISHDVPHQGANVPLAFQSMVRHLAGEDLGFPVFISAFELSVTDLTDIAPDLQDGLDILQSPAAQQMLIYQLSGVGSITAHTTNSLRTSFATEYRNLGYPTQGGIRNIAISNGSECGTSLGFANNAVLASVNETIDLPFFVTNIVLTVLNTWSGNPLKALTSFLSTNTDVRMDFEMRALPDHATSRLYKGKCYIKKKILGFITVEEDLINEKTLNALSSQLPLDNAGGGIYDINQFTDVPDDYLIEQSFGFIPTYSSLDIGGGSQTISTSDLRKTYTPMDFPDSPKNTPFANFFTNPTTSENHTQFTLNNGNWLLDELDQEGANGFYSCISSCSSTSPLSISGASKLCSSNVTYSLPGLPSGLSVSWSVSPTSLFAVDAGTGSSFTTRATSSSSSGQGIITVVIADDCGSTTISKDVWVGQPSVAGVYGKQGAGGPVDPAGLYYGSSGGYNSVCNYVEYVTDMSIGGHTSQTWQQVSGPSNISWGEITYAGEDSRDIEFYLWSVGQTATFRLTASNSCGSVIYDFPFKSINCEPDDDPCTLSVISPNPASSTVVVYIDAPDPGDPCIPTLASSSTALAKSDLNLDITLRDHSGKVVDAKSIRKTTSKVELDVTGLQEGIYLLEVATGSYTEQHKIIVKD